MSGKQSKNQRRAMRKIFKKQYAEYAEFFAKENERTLKPKPKWFPMWLWIKLLGIFVKIKK